ncbi:MAG: hypothetical protein L0387_17075 [Acidobacteria bacterium]|nr:hypothetical protein [Acidobacteriota bacterium]MCI0717652.1 hypothetical protein [Acidobacteriota bacterium]
MITIEVDPKTAQILQALRERATAQGTTLDALLQSLVQNDGARPLSVPISLAEIDRILDELAAGSENVAPLPSTFSREDIYSDHD